MHIKPINNNTGADSRKPAPNVSDLMLMIVATAISAALIKMHSEDATLKFRLSNHPPASVWTRLLLGHCLTGTGLVFGTSRLYLLIRKRLSDRSFGHWLWIVTSLYLSFYIAASLLWALLNLIITMIRNPHAQGISPFVQPLGRIFILSSQQACFDQFAWLIAAIWISFRLLHFSSGADQILESREVSQKSDHTIAIYSGMVIASTMFQRFIESIGF